MKKSFIKFGKFLLSCIIILCINFSTYASLGGYDGDTFVTIAEFQSAISDFNGRLSSFEISINSKIDTQVGSYLDRNGIWSGKEQEMTNALHRYGITKSWHNTVNSVSNMEGNNDVLIQEGSLINKINKAGLCNLELETFKLGDANPTSWQNGTVDINNNSQDGYGSVLQKWLAGSSVSSAADVTSYRAHLWAYVKFVENNGISNEDKIYFTLANSSPTVKSWTINSDNYAHCISFVPNKQSLYFFVNNGSKLSYQVRMALASNYYSSTPYKFTLTTTGSTTGYWGMKIDCSVY